MKTILVVDDELAIAEMLDVILEDEGYHVVTASNGQEGLTAIARERPDMVIADLMMPILGGEELCHAIKADPARASIPVALMSAVGPQLIHDGTNYQGFLGKPFELDEVLALVTRLIGKP